MGKKSKKSRSRQYRPEAKDEGLSGLKPNMKRMAKDFRDREKEEILANINSMCSFPLPTQRSVIRRALTELAGTDVQSNDADPTGDGDQSPIGTEAGRQAARDLYSSGGDITSHCEQGALSPFARLCVVGDAASIRSALARAAASARAAGRPPSRDPALLALLETRETSMRLSPLLLTVAAGKNVLPAAGGGGGIAGLDHGMDHVGVVRALLEFGARPDARDVLGKTAAHYGAGAAATDMTLRAVDLCISAARTSHLLGRDVELRGLSNGALNGTRGVGGGFLSETGRRAVFIPERRGDVAVLPEKVRLLPADGPSLGCPPMLADVQDRLGSVALHEVVMFDRVDCAELLLGKYHASVDIADPDGMSPKKMCMGLVQSAVRVGPMILREAKSRGAMERQKDKKRCSYCRAECDKPSGMKQCCRCRKARYCNEHCQRSHWNAGHKKECKKLASSSGIKLEPPKISSRCTASINFSSDMLSTGGSYRKPDNVGVDEEFLVKVQALPTDRAPLFLYDKTRQCMFDVSPGQQGFTELLKACREEQAYDGRKCFLKATFDSSGCCHVFPGTAKLKERYDW